MNVFDIIGPIMIGPSSSHTAGACRIGKFAREIIGSKPSTATISFSGSFAKTYKGHGTDKAVVAGLLGFLPNDERLRDSLDIAKKEGIDITITCKEIELAHPNTVRIITKTTDDNEINLVGASVGGGNILITELNGIPLSVDGMYDTLIIVHDDIPGMIMKITTVLNNHNINVNGLNLYRNEKGGKAVVIVQVDDNIDNDRIREELEKVDNVIRVRVLEALRE